MDPGAIPAAGDEIEGAQEADGAGPKLGEDAEQVVERRVRKARRRPGLHP
jgi:hypothetical protein